MEKGTKDFLNKIKIDTYIYTFTFLAVCVGYSLKHAVGPESSMLLVAAFAFYSIGRQVRLLPDLEKGATVDTQPKVPAWIRGIVFLVVILMILNVIFS